MREAASILCRHRQFAAVAAALAFWSATMPGAGAVTLTAPKDVLPDIAAYPRIANPSDAAQRRINAALDRLDAKVRAAARACISGAPRQGDWERHVDTPMRGPEFVSYRVTDDVDCGGAHPNNSHAAIVYDLRTGAPVDWTALLPPQLTGTLALADGEDGVRMVTLASPRLFALYRAGYDAGPVDPDEEQCRGAVAGQGESGPVPMLAWLDAERGGLALQFDFAHVEQACSEPIVISVDALRREGASERLLAALQAAHEAGR